MAEGSGAFFGSPSTPSPRIFDQSPMKNAVVLAGLLTIATTLSAQPSLRLRAHNSDALRTRHTVVRGGSHYNPGLPLHPTPATHSDLAARGIRLYRGDSVAVRDAGGGGAAGGVEVRRCSQWSRWLRPLLRVCR
jgi:hypothetical protein